MSKNTNVVPGRLTTATTNRVYITTGEGTDYPISSNPVSAQNNTPNNLLSLLQQYLPGYETASQFGRDAYDYFNPIPKAQYSYDPLTENEWVHAQGDLDTLSMGHLINEWDGDIPQINKIQMIPGQDYGVSRPIINYNEDEQEWKRIEEAKARRNEFDYRNYGNETSEADVEWWK